MATWSNGVTIVGDSPNRRVVAARPLRRGETILEERPALSLLHPKQWGLRCNHCFQKASPNKDKLMRCSQCKCFRYCSRACQKLDWVEHRGECTGLRQQQQQQQQKEEGSDDENILADALLVSRVVRWKETQPEKFEAVMDLVFHPEWVQPAHHRIVQLVESMGLLHTEEMFELLARFDANNFGIVDDLLFFMGAGIYPAGAMLNHSCDHNCAIQYEFATSTQRKQIIRCIVDVAVGDELCHPYIDFASTAEQRREKLSSTYSFDCQCARCVDETGRWAKSDALLTTINENQARAAAIQTTLDMTDLWLQQAAAMDDDNMTGELQLVQQCVDARALVLHPRHLALYTARSQLHTAAVAAGDMQVARDQCVEIVATMRTCFYRPEHPLMGVMVYTLGSLHHTLGDFGKAIGCYERALPVLEGYHGMGHDLTISCRSHLQQAHQEAGL